MSTEFIGFAERIFSINPRPAALLCESAISNLVLLDMVIQVLLLGYILLDNFICAPMDALNTEVANEYITQVCGTDIRKRAYLYYMQKIIFLTFFLLIFYLNKVMVARVNRYHTILFKEKLPYYLSMNPIYKNVNYFVRWRFTIVAFVLYKIAAFLLLSLLIAGSDNLSYRPSCRTIVGLLWS